MVTRLITAALVTAIGSAYATGGITEILNLAQNAMSDPISAVSWFLRFFVQNLK